MPPASIRGSSQTEAYGRISEAIGDDLTSRTIIGKNFPMDVMAHPVEPPMGEIRRSMTVLDTNKRQIHKEVPSFRREAQATAKQNVERMSAIPSIPYSLQSTIDSRRVNDARQIVARSVKNRQVEQASEKMRGLVRQWGASKAKVRAPRPEQHKRIRVTPIDQPAVRKEPALVSLPSAGIAEPEPGRMVVGMQSTGHSVATDRMRDIIRGIYGVK
jgi:hypothetical protein